MKLPSVTGCYSFFTVVSLFFSLALSTMTFEVSLRKTVPLRMRLMLFAKVWIYMKSYYDFLFFRIVLFIQRIQVCDSQKRPQNPKTPKKFINSSKPQNTQNLWKPKRTAQKFAKPKKIGFGQISYPKNSTRIPS